MLQYNYYKRKGKNTMSFKIVTDSSADLTTLDGVAFESVPLKINTTEREYVDNAELDVIGMLSDLKKYKGKSHSSCPNSEEYLRAFGDAENVFCITITSGLSGSYNSAATAAKMYLEEHPDRKIHVIDSLSTGAENALVIYKLRDLILEGKDFDTVKAEIIAYHDKVRLLFALESMHNLANNGRVSHLAAKMAGILGIRAIGRASDVGTLEMICKSRGIKSMIADIVNRLGLEGYKGGKIRIHHADNLSAAETLKEKILEKYREAKVIISTTRGLCSFYAEAGGLLVGFEI